MCSNDCRKMLEIFVVNFLHENFNNKKICHLLLQFYANLNGKAVDNPLKFSIALCQH